MDELISQLYLLLQSPQLPSGHPLLQQCQHERRALLCLLQQSGDLL